MARWHASLAKGASKAVIPRTKGRFRTWASDEYNFAYFFSFASNELSHRQNLTFEDIRDRVEPLLDVKVTQVNWFSTYRVHHRVADRFRVGRAFLVGDAGHIHSPAGGQGMNTGIGDAVNLGWKIASTGRLTKISKPNVASFTCLSTSSP